MYRVSGISIMVAGLTLLLGAEPGWAGPPNNDVSDAKGNTAGGSGALVNNSGAENTAFGSFPLFFNTTGSDNTAFGGGALIDNTAGSGNTAVGALTLAKNTTGVVNTAVGEAALQKNTTGGSNTAVGSSALASNTIANDNTAFGTVALQSNTTGFQNTAGGSGALRSNTNGIRNTAVGFSALQFNTTGGNNTTFGHSALLSNTTGNQNTAVGLEALPKNTTGSNNIALGFGAGDGLTSGSNNIYVGGFAGAATESQTIRLGQTQTRTFVAGVAGTPLSGSQVLVSSTGQLGILASSARYKAGIRDMGARSRGLFGLRPVTFRYKEDPEGTRQYGLIAEEVAKVYPELVTRRSDGAVESVQYHELIPMLLNELERQQRELGELKAQNERLQATLGRQTAALAMRLVRLERPHTASLASR